jgi:hypothetical protein
MRTVSGNGNAARRIAPGRMTNSTFRDGEGVVAILVGVNAVSAIGAAIQPRSQDFSSAARNAARPAGAARPKIL